MNYKDGFIVLDVNNGFCLTQRPDEVFYSNSYKADDFMSAYGVRETSDEALEDFQEDAEELRAASQATGLRNAPPRELLKRARVYETGKMTVFPALSSASAAIGDSEVPQAELSRADIYGAYGLADPVAPFAAEAGEHVCFAEIRIINEEEFRDCFKLKDSEDLASADMSGIFVPFTKGDMGGVLKSVELSRGEPAGNGEDRYLIRLVADIHDPDLLAVNVMRSLHEQVETPAEAIFEIWFGGNEVGSPVDMGFEIWGWGPEQAEEPSEEPGF